MIQVCSAGTYASCRRFAVVALLFLVTAAYGANAAPTVVTPAAASPNPVTATSTTLTALGADDAGESLLTYTWAQTGTPPASVTFPGNGLNGAKAMGIAFTKAGSYGFQVTIRDTGNLTATSSVTVVVNQTVTSLTVTPAIVYVPTSSTQIFSVVASDQFGNPVSPAPSFSWTTTGGGALVPNAPNTTATLTAQATVGGPFTITATTGTKNNTATAYVQANTTPQVVSGPGASINPVPGNATVLSVSAEDDGGESNLVYTWAATGTPPAAVSFSPNALNAAKNTTATFTATGNYALQVTIRDTAGLTVVKPLQVSVSQTTASIVVTPASPTLTHGTTQQFTASARDQFGIALAVQPTFDWSVTGGGTIGNGQIGTTRGMMSVQASEPGTFAVNARANFVTGSTPVSVLPANTPPTVATPVAAASNPVQGTSVGLTVLGADDGGETNLTYAWATTGSPPAAVVFSANNSNAAKATTATFTKPGSYSFQVTMKDASQQVAVSSLTLAVSDKVTVIALTPSSATVATSGTQQFTAAATNQFGTAVSPTPTFAWSVSGGGSIAGSGLFTAGSSAGGPHTVSAVAAGVTGTATISVSTGSVTPTVATAAAASPSTVTGTTTSLSVLGADAGGEAGLVYTWATTGTPPAPVTFSANGTNAAKSTIATFTKIGSYTLQCTIRNASYRTVTSSATVTVNATSTAIVVTPATLTVPTQSKATFTANMKDQFGNALGTQPSFTWSATGGGSVVAGSPNTTATFTANSTAGGPYQVKAVNGSITGQSTINTIANTAPTVAVAPAAAASPVIATTTQVSVTGADDGGEGNLIYTWSKQSGPGTVSFSANGTNASKTVTATFSALGSYVLACAIRDSANVTTTPTLSVSVEQGVTSLQVALHSDAEPNVAVNRDASLYVTPSDQFGAIMSVSNPVAYVWTVSGGGTISFDADSNYARFRAGPATMGSVTATVRHVTSGKTATKTFAITGSSAPRFTKPLSAIPNPVTGQTTRLSSVISYDANFTAGTITYTTVGITPAAVEFVDETEVNLATDLINPQVTARFSRAGSYVLAATFVDPSGSAITSTIPVDVIQTVTTMAVTPAAATLTSGQSSTFTVSAFDQFGNVLNPLPAFTWATTGGGTLAPQSATTAQYTAGATSGGPFSVTATALAGSASAHVIIPSPGNTAPTIATVAAAAPNPVTTMTCALTALGADNAGEGALRYCWSTVGSPPAPVRFSSNGTNAAKTTTVTFSRTGTYQFECAIVDAGGLSVTTMVSVTVQPTLTTVWVVPTAAQTRIGQTVQYGIVGGDQFSDAISSALPTPTWIASGGGTISSTGLYSATSNGNFTVRATVGSLTSSTVPIKVVTGNIVAVSTPFDVVVTPWEVDASETRFNSAQIKWSFNGPVSYSPLYSFRVFRDGIPIGTQTASSTFCFYADRGTLKAGRTYSYQVMGVDPDGSVSPLSAPTLYSTPTEASAPTPPAALWVTAKTDAIVSLEWESSLDPEGSGVVDYEIFRNGTLVTSVTGVSWSDQGLSPTTAYTYKVRARDASNNYSAFSPSVTATTTLNQTPPPPPSGLITTGQTSTSVSLSWTAPAVPVAGYLVAVGGSQRVSTAGTTATVTDLIPGTAYTFSVMSVDAIGLPSTSISLAVTTSADTTAPTVPTGLASPSKTASSVTLTWTASTDASGIKQYAVFRNGSQAALTTGPVTTYTDTGRAANTNYTYAVKAIDTKGNQSALSSNLVVTTLTDTVPPSVPSPPQATATTYTSVTLAWAPSTDNVAVSTYTIFKDGVSAGTSTTPSFTVSSLLPGTSASYTIQAKDAANNLSTISGATVIPTLVDDVPPTAPTNLLVSARTATSLTVSWTAASDGTGSGVVGYQVYRDGVLVGSPTTTSLANTGLVTSQSYTFTVLAKDRANNLSPLCLPLVAQPTTDTAAPTVPTALASPTKTTTTVTLTWSPSTDTVGVTGYDVLRAGTTIARIASTTFTDSGLKPGTAYAYTLRAYNAKGNRSAATSALNVTTLADVEIPTTPLNVIATAVTASSVTLGWMASSDDTGVARYDILKGGTVIGNTTTTTYVCTGLFAKTAYDFTVKAIDLANKTSDASNVVTVTTGDDTQAPSVPWKPTITSVTATSVVLSWIKANDNVAIGTYRVLRNGAVVATVSTTTHTDTGLIPATTYSYTLIAVDQAGNASVASDATAGTTLADTTAPTAPTNLGWSAKTDHSVTMSWVAATDTGGSGVTQYLIQRNGVQVGQVATLTFTDEGLTPDTVYAYTVVAKDVGGNLSSSSLGMSVRTNRDETPPSIPQNLSSSQQTTSAIALSWSASTDNVGVVRYEIQRDGVIIATLTSTSHTDQPAIYAVSYAYCVRAVDALENASPWSSLIATARPAETTSVLVEATAFDPVKWGNDATYRQTYLQGHDPGRVWQSASGAAGVPTLAAIGPRFVIRAVGATGPSDLAIKTAPNAPVTLVILKDGHFIANKRNVITVQADATGIAHVGFVPTTSGRTPILASSPLAVGQVRFVVEAP